METIVHFFTSLDLWQVIFSSFLTVINPVIHSFEQYFITGFSEMKHLVSGNFPVFYSVMLFLVLYSFMQLLQWLKKILIPVKSKQY